MHAVLAAPVHRRRAGGWLAAACLLAIAGCGGPAPSQSPSQSAASQEAPAQEAPAQPTAAADRSGEPAGQGEPIRVDIDELFPAGPGRDLVLNNCQNCHTFVPIVVLAMNDNAWERNSFDHRERVPNLTDAEFAEVYAYLKKNFGPDHQAPKLPEALLETWTSY